MLKKLIFTGFIGISTLFASDSASSISASQALQMLKDGNQRFIDGKSIHPHSDFERIKEVSTGQKPFVTINGCSDSRVPPELIFDQGFGDVFVVRNAGNVSDTDEVGTIEYGTEHLGTNLVVVMGHTKCGAVTAVAKGDHVEGSIPKLVDNIVPAVEKVKHSHKNEEYTKWINEAISENVNQSIKDILSKSEIVSKLVKEGKVKVVGAVYDVDTGKVSFIESK